MEALSPARGRERLGGDGRCVLDVLGAGGGVSLSAVVVVDDSSPRGRLQRCLDELDQVASEVLVVDTTTTGLGVALDPARRVHRPELPAHGGRVRSEAEGLVGGEWVLHLRCGEHLGGEGGALLTRLGASGADVVAVPVRSGSSAPDVHEVRVVRRGRVAWVGCIDAVPVAADECRALARQDFAPTVWIRADPRAAHESGTAVPHLLAELDLNGSDRDRLRSSLALARRSARAGETIRAAELAHVVIDAARDVDLVVEAMIFVEALRTAPRQDASTVAEQSLDDIAAAFATRALAEGSPHRAATVLRAVVDGTADTRVQASSSHLSSDRATTITALAEAMGALGRFDEAARLLVRAAMISPARHDLDVILATFERSSLLFHEVFELVHVDVRGDLVRQALERPTSQSSEWLRRLASTSPASGGLLVGGAGACVGLGARLAFPWAVLVRERGVPQHCPLRTIAQGRPEDLTDVYLACLLLDTIFGEPAPLQRLVAAGVSERVDGARVAQQLELLQASGTVG